MSLVHVIYKHLCIIKNQFKVIIDITWLDLFIIGPTTRETDIQIVFSKGYWEYRILR